MRLTLRILHQYIERFIPCTAEAETAGGVLLEGVLLYEEGMQIPSGWAVLLPPETRSLSGRCPEDALLICLSEETVCPPGVPRLLLPASVTVSGALNLAARAFSYYEEWDRALRGIQDDRGQVTDMLHVSLEIFRNPLALFAEDMTLTAQAGIPEGEARFRIFEQGRDRMDAITAILQDEAYEENRRRTDAYFGPEYLTGIRTLNWNIRRNRETTYILEVLEHQHPLTPADGDLLEVLGFHIKFVLYEQNGAGREVNLHKTLRKILTDRTLDYMEGGRALEECGWKGTDTYLCLVYQLTYLDRRSIPVTSICEYMENQYTSCASLTLGDEIVTFFDLTGSGMDQDEIFRQLRPFIRDSYLKAGFSRQVTGYMHLRRQYIQAKLALDVGSRHDPYQWIHYFDRIAFSYMLEQLTRRLPEEMIVHPGVLRLMESDREHGTEYRKTLKVYLDHQCNAVQSARELFIHRSTFLYRIGKIREITESSLTDPEELLYLNLSLSLLERNR